MIRKRPTTEKTSENSNSTVGISNDITDNSHPRFKTYREEAIYVINLLKEQGVDIYAEGRKGGMYLKQNKDSQLFELFRPETNNVNNEKDNNREDAEFAAFFSK